MLFSKLNLSIIIFILIVLSTITNSVLIFNGTNTDNDKLGIDLDKFAEQDGRSSSFLIKNQEKNTVNIIDNQLTLPSLDLPSPLPQPDISIDSGTSVKTDFLVNDELTFWAVDYGLLSTTGNWVTSFYETNATVRAISAHSVIFVENTLLGTYDQTFAEGFANEFETNIWNSEVPYFGVPPDVDGDGKVSVFVMDIEDGSSGGSYIAGVFLRLHEYDPASFPSDPIIQHSMLMEIVHIDTRAISDGNANGTLAHEFQHLLHFNSDPDETLWIDEAAATYSSYKAGYFSDVDEYFSNSDSNYFLFNTDSSLTYWESSIRDYATVFLFFLYLSERFGPNIIGEIVNSTLIDQVSILNVLQTNYGYIGTFIDVFTDWTIANTLDIEGSVEYGYENFNLSARIPTLISNYPKTYSESVTYWGTDIYEFSATSSPSNLKINFLGDINGEFSISTLIYSNIYLNWTINSFDSNSIVNNELNIFIPQFTLNENSKVILLISSVDGVSSGVDVVNEGDYQNTYNLSAKLASTEIIYDYDQFDQSGTTVIMKGITVEDPQNFWNFSSIVYANYSIINLDSNKTLEELSQNLTYNAISSTFELNINKSFLLPGTYQIHIFISNGTTVLELLSPDFETSFEDFAFFNYNNQTMIVIINSIHLEALNPSWNASSLIYANFSIIDSNTKEIIENFSQNLTYNYISSTYELEVNVSLLSDGTYKIFMFISNGTSSFEIFSPSFEILHDNPTGTSTISSVSSTTTTPTNSVIDSNTNKSITTTPLILDPLTIFLVIVVFSYQIIKRRREKI